MDETVEQEEEVIIENIEDPVLERVEDSVEEENKENEKEEQEKENEVPSIVPAIRNIDEEPVITRLTFNDYDSIMNDDNKVEEVNAPKTIERLEEISTERAMQRKMEEDDDDDNERIRIDTGGNIDLGMLDIFDLNSSEKIKTRNEDSLLDDIMEII
jgi:hypothetical protein